MTNEHNQFTAPDPEEWQEMMAEMNESFAAALEENVQAQTTFVETWFESLERTLDEDRIQEEIEGYANAHEIWMNAMEQGFERSRDAAAGEEVEATEFRDIWLNAANEAFKEVSSTAAFAAMTGQTVEEAMQLRQEIDRQAEDTLETLGFATRSDIVEIGERFIELERRQHAVEQKLDQLIEALED